MFLYDVYYVWIPLYSFSMHSITMGKQFFKMVESLVESIHFLVLWYDTSIHLHSTHLLRNWNNQINWLNGQQFKILNTLNFHCLYLGRFQRFEICLLILSFVSLVIVKAKKWKKAKVWKIIKKDSNSSQMLSLAQLASAHKWIFCLF